MVKAIHEHRPNSKLGIVWTPERRKQLLGMFGYFGKTEMARRMNLTEPQIKAMTERMGGSYRVTKNPEDYVE